MAEIDALKKECNDLFRAATTKSALSDAIEACKNGDLFADCWSAVKGPFDHLSHCFVDKITFVFPAGVLKNRLQRKLI